MNHSRLRSLLQRAVPMPAEGSALKVQLAIFTAVSVLLYVGFSAQRELRVIAEREHVQVLFRGWDGPEWFVWLLSAPALLILINRFPLHRGQLRRSLVGLIVGSLVIYLVVTNLRYLLRILPNIWLSHSEDLPTKWPNYVVSMEATLPMDFLTYCSFLSASFAIDYFYKIKRRGETTLRLQLQAAQLQSELTRAELSALRAQLHPHFLFNSFNAVASLVRQHRNEAAVAMITQVCTLLRLALERTNIQLLNLADEIEFVRNYLEVEGVRFGDKLRLEFDCSPGALKAKVPNFLLQPLAENAIKHGISLRTEPGTIWVLARVESDRLLIEIANDGVEDPPVNRTREKNRMTGIGLANTRARLERLYGSEFRLELVPRPHGGMRVLLNLPLRPPDALSLGHEKNPNTDRR